MDPSPILGRISFSEVGEDLLRLVVEFEEGRHASVMSGLVNVVFRSGPEEREKLLGSDPGALVEVSIFIHPEGTHGSLAAVQVSPGDCQVPGGQLGAPGLLGLGHQDDGQGHHQGLSDH